VIPTNILVAANQEPSIRGRVHPRNDRIVRVPISFEGVVVGFYCPHRAACGLLRLGPIYVLPEFRGRGLVTAIYRTIKEPMMAAILDSDVASMRAHERVGFVRWKRFAAGWHMRRGGEGTDLAGG
jgi:hypothetical protein